MSCTNDWSILSALIGSQCESLLAVFFEVWQVSSNTRLK